MHPARFPPNALVRLHKGRDYTRPLPRRHSRKGLRTGRIFFDRRRSADMDRPGQSPLLRTRTPLQCVLEPHFAMFLGRTKSPLGGTAMLCYAARSAN